VSGRARRATRPTPERISVPCGHGTDFSSRQRAWGHAAARFAPRSPASLPLVRLSLGNSLGSRAGTPTGPRDMAGERGAATVSSADARDPMTRPSESATASNRCRRQPAARSWAIERSKIKRLTRDRLHQDRPLKDRERKAVRGPPAAVYAPQLSFAAAAGTGSSGWHLPLALGVPPSAIRSHSGPSTTFPRVGARRRRAGSQAAVFPHAAS
jgi:hypothetical protein